MPCKVPCILAPKLMWPVGETDVSIEVARVAEDTLEPQASLKAGSLNCGLKGIDVRRIVLSRVQAQHHFSDTVDGESGCQESPNVNCSWGVGGVGEKSRRWISEIDAAVREKRREPCPSEHQHSETANQAAILPCGQTVAP